MANTAPEIVTIFEENNTAHDSELLCRPHPLPLRSPSTTTGRGQSGRSKSHLMADIPSSADFYAPVGPSSASPSSWSIASSDTGPSSASSVIEKIRFERLANGSHRHHLSAPKRQQFLSNQVRRLRELLDGKREREDPQHHPQTPPHTQTQLKPEVFQHPLSLLNEKYQDLDTDQTGSPVSNNRRGCNVKTDYVQKYGELQHVIGKGAFGTVRLSVKRIPESSEEHVYAVKEFKYAHGESQKLYMRRLTSEFCIASSLKHMNVIQTMDLLQLHGDTYSEVMEYCAGGDLHSLIASSNTLSEAESNCFFSQLVNGVAFLHSMGVVHRDLKPENLLLTSDGCLKIADFGNSEVFRMPWEKKVRASASIRGTGPFTAPEEFTDDTFDARKVDMWACGIIYMCMRLGRYTWHEASDGDPIWDGFLYKRARLLEMDEDNPHNHLGSLGSVAVATTATAEYQPTHINLTALEQVSHITLAWPKHIYDVIEHLIEPDTRQRWQATHVLDSEWLNHIDNCHPTARPPDQVLDESEFEPAVPSQRVGSKVIPKNAAITGCKIVKEVRDKRATSAVASVADTETIDNESIVAPPVS
ncbi:serine/threonine-protein kinase HAL4/sat4 [Mortierella sp. GBA30]|nr:serine/threonine-protein kinase HAL4/sat4 [Mortierella sp. GBA30]